MREVGLFCGTFNPIHLGHLMMAESARDQFQLEKVLFITSATPPHRPSGLLDKEARHELVVAAIANNPYFEASRLELDRDGPSYTIDTIRAVKNQHPEFTRVNLILGEDNLAYLAKWRESDEIQAMCRLLVAPRDFPSPNPKYASDTPGSSQLPDASIEMMDFPLIPISASEIRDRLRTGRSVRYMVTQEVHEILMQKRYYQDIPAGSL